MTATWLATLPAIACKSQFLSLRPIDILSLTDVREWSSESDLRAFRVDHQVDLEPCQ